MKNFDMITKGLSVLHEELTPYLYETLHKHYKEEWWDKGVINKLSEPRKKNLPLHGEKADLLNSVDLLLCLIILDRNWGEVYSRLFSDECRLLVKNTIHIRNRWAHKGINDFSDSETEEILEELTALITQINPQIKVNNPPLHEDLKKMLIPIDGKMIKSLILIKGIKNGYSVKIENSQITLEETLHVNPIPLTLLLVGFKAVRKAVADTPFHFNLTLKPQTINKRKLTFSAHPESMLDFIIETEFVKKNRSEVILDLDYFQQLSANPTKEITHFNITGGKLWLEVD